MNRQGLIVWFTRHPVAANLLMVALIVAGSFSCWSIRKESLPEIKLDMIRVTIAYPGAAPNEVEAAVCIKVEEALRGLTGVKNINSYASEGQGIISLELMRNAKLPEVLDRVKARVDAIDSFPAETQHAVIEEVPFKPPVMRVIISADFGERQLKNLSETIRDELMEQEGVSQIEIHGVRDEEISVEVSDANVRRFGLSLDAVADAVRQGSIDLPGGRIKSEGGEIFLRSPGKVTTASQIADILLRTSTDGSRITVGDVAHVRDGFAESSSFVRFQGKPAVSLQVFRVGDESTLAIAKAVNRYIEKKKSQLPDGIELVVVTDTSKELKDRLKLMIKNIALGGVLVFICLALFLRLKIAFWVMVGLPISFLGTIWFMSLPLFDISINMVTLFGFIIVLGILVDDAIVIAENIHTTIDRDGPGANSVITGARQVATPATFGVLTTMAAFVPILSIPGVNGKLWSGIGFVVILCLFFSLVESKLILPAHLLHLGKGKKNTQRKGWFTRLQISVDNGLRWIVEQIYKPMLTIASNHSYTTAAVFVSLVIITVAMCQIGGIRFVFFPEIEADAIQAHLVMPSGSATASTMAAVSRVEQAVASVNADVSRRTGARDKLIQRLVTIADSETEIYFYAELLPSEMRNLGSNELIRLWREKIGTLPGVQELIFQGMESDGGSSIDFQLEGSDIDRLRAAAIELKTHLSDYDGVFDVRDSYRQGSRELHYHLKPEGEAMGITNEDLARWVRHGYYGAKALTLQKGHNEVDVMVRYPLAERSDLNHLEQMRVRTAQEHTLTFSRLAELTWGRSDAIIERADRRRVMHVQADIDKSISDPGKLNAQLEKMVLPEILKRYPGVKYQMAGEARDKEETLASLMRNGALALVAIFALMAIPLNSYGQPIIIMAAIPFGLVGAVWGHWLLGLPISILSLCGLIALAGVIVNDGLVITDAINSKRKEDVPLKEAVAAAGPDRFRAIILTSLTTFIGLTPMLMEQSIQAQYLIPMSVSLAFGILFATFINLLLIPCLYLIGADISLKFSKLSKGKLLQSIFLRSHHSRNN